MLRCRGWEINECGIERLGLEREESVIRGYLDMDRMFA